MLIPTYHVNHRGEGRAWQVIPRALPQMLMDENSEKAQRVMRSMLQMRKIDLAALKQAQAA